MYSLVYLLSLSLVLLLALAVHVYVLKPYLEGPALRTWYSRQNVQWIGDGNLINENLSAYILGRHVSYDAATGSVRPLECDVYTHVFLATSEGRPVVIEAVDAGTYSGRRLRVRNRMTLEYRDVKDLTLRPYVFQCCSSLDSWRNHFRDGSDSEKRQHSLEALKRYSYTVGFEPPLQSRDVGSPPKSVTEAVLSVTRATNVEPVLTFTFLDSRTGNRTAFQLPAYIRSAFADVPSPANPSDPNGTVWERLPELWLTRHNKRNMDEEAAHDVVLFAADGQPPTSRAIGVNNPCWANSLNRFVVGDFPVTVDQYTGIYLRGLQRLTETDLEANPDARRAFNRLYWKCVYDYDSRVNQRLAAVNVTNEDKSSPSRPNLGINVESILYNTLLSLNACAPNQRFDAETLKCTPTTT